MAGLPTESIEKLPKTDIPSISTADLREKLAANEDIVLLDIRIANIFQKHRIESPRMVNIPIEALDARVKEIPAGKKVVIIDEIGKRSKIAGRYLSLKGFRDIVTVDGGIQKWMTDGYQVRYDN